MRIRSAFLIGVSMISFGGCKSSIGDAIAMHRLPAPALTLPSAHDVSRIEVIDNSHSANKTLRVATEVGRISKIMEFTRGINNGWFTNANTFPGPKYTITFENGNNFLMVLWLGPGWMGGRDNTNNGKCLRDISPSQTNELGDLLNVHFMFDDPSKSGSGK